MALPQPVGAPLTVADLEAMPDDGRRYELIGGAIVMTAAPVPVHQRISRRLQRLLDETAPPGHEVFCAPIDLDLPGGQRVQPDVVVLPRTSVGEKRLTLPVLLVVEIVSAGSRTHDTVTKRTTYAEAGIPAYWMVDTDTARVTCLRLAGGTYEPYAEGSVIEVDWPLVLHVDAAALTRPPEA